MSKYEEGFKVYAVLQGFDIQGFDKWLPSLEGTGAYDELVQRRKDAMAAMVANDEASVLRHLEWMLIRWRWITRVNALEPMAALGQKFKPKGRGKGPIRKKIEQLLKKNPKAKTAELWEAIKAKPPKGWHFMESPRLGSYIEGPENQSMSHRVFANHVSAEKKALKN